MDGRNWYSSPPAIRLCLGCRLAGRTFGTFEALTLSLSYCSQLSITKWELIRFIPTETKWSFLGFQSGLNWMCSKMKTQALQSHALEASKNGLQLTRQGRITKATSSFKQLLKEGFWLSLWHLQVTQIAGPRHHWPGTMEDCCQTELVLG